MRFLTLVLAVLTPVAQAPGIIGTWRGASACVDKETYPACTDEEVIYDVTRLHHSPDSVTIRADRIVNGERQSMGEGVFVRDSGGTWINNISTPRFHGRWSIRVTGGELTGTLTGLAANRVVRRIALRKTS